MNEKILYLHMGLPKTGSSALQVFFAKNTRPFYQNGFRYPGAMGDIAAGERISSGNAVKFARFGFTRDAETPDALRALAMIERALAFGDRHVLLSSEYFAPWPAEKHQKLKELAARHGFRVKPIFYLRDQGDMTVTHYFQHLKRIPGAVDLSGSGFRSFAKAYLRNPFLDFNTHAQMLQSVYGDDAPIVGTTRRNLQVGNSIFTDVLAAMGLDPSGFDFDIPKINPTPTQQEMYVRALIGLFNPSVGFSDAFLRTVATLHQRLNRAGLPEHNFFIDPDEVSSIRERFAESNKAVCARYFGGKTPEEAFDMRSYGPRARFDATTVDLDTVIALFGGLMVELTASSSTPAPSKNPPPAKP